MISSPALGGAAASMSSACPVVFEHGDLDAGIWTVGTAQGLIHDIPTAGELVDRIVADAESLIAERLTSAMVPVSA